MKIIKPAVAGTLESGDVMIRIEPCGTKMSPPNIDLHINSSVEKQFGRAIRKTIMDILGRYNVENIEMHIDDKGALDCVLRARLETAVARGAGIDVLPWKDEK